MITPKGAFCRSITADLVHVPLALPTEHGGATPYRQSLCSVNDELTEEIGALFNSDVYGKRIALANEHQQGIKSRGRDIELLDIKECIPGFERKLQYGT